MSNMSTMSPVERAIYQALMDHDFERAAAIREHQRRQYEEEVRIRHVIDNAYYETQYMPINPFTTWHLQPGVTFDNSDNAPDHVFQYANPITGRWSMSYGTANVEEQPKKKDPIWSNLI